MSNQFNNNNLAVNIKQKTKFFKLNEDLQTYFLCHNTPFFK